MNNTTLPVLPLEILQQIASSVEAVHQPSLSAFSLTCKACHLASTFLVFRRISITVQTREGLCSDIHRLAEALSRTDSTRHVRSITVKGALELIPKKPGQESKENTWLDWWRGTGLDEINLDEELTDYRAKFIVYDGPVIKKFLAEDMAWAPFVGFLNTISYLQDLVYDCQNQFPPSLLKALHEQHPQCRLHHLTFRFRTLLWGVPYPYEMELATSPSLYRVKAACSWRDSDGDDDFNQEAIMELVTGLAPNLKEVIVLDLFPILSNRYLRERESWHGLPGFTGKTRGSLKSLMIKGYADLRQPKPIKDWARHTDFACLQHLALEGCYDAKTCVVSGDTMEWVTQNCTFPQLRTLSVWLCRDDMFLDRPHYSQQAVYFFQIFENLEALTILGPLDDQIVDAVLSHQGQTLKKLSLTPYESPFNVDNGRDRKDIPLEFTKKHLLQIQARCPVLEELEIPIKRDKSSASEAELYKCLSKFGSLRYLFLTLDCSNWRVRRDSSYDPQFDEEDDALMWDHNDWVKKGYVKNTFLNCAVDEVLARSIWETVSQNKVGRRLERLKLWTAGGGNYGCSTYYPDSEVAKDLSRSWLIERVVRDDQNEITVRELGQRAREARHREAREREERLPTLSSGEPMSEDETEQFLRTIWPQPSDRGDDTDWRDDWESVPLEV